MINIMIICMCDPTSDMIQEAEHLDLYSKKSAKINVGNCSDCHSFLVCCLWRSCSSKSRRRSKINCFP